MDRATRRLFVVVLIVVIAATGGAALILGTVVGPPVTSPSADASDRGPDGDPSGPPGTIPVEGVVVGVESAGLSDVRGFTLRDEGGATIDLLLEELENATEFPPGHLAEHQASAEPVRVWYRETGGQRYAIRLEDAGG